jgi:alpha-tubulin suppressor-like RCC1 family protein
MRTNVPRFAFPGGALSNSVQIEDAFGNAVAEAGVLVTATIASGPQGASLVGATATTGPDGYARFDDLAIFGPDGMYSLRLSASGKAGLTTSVVTLMRFTMIAPALWHTCALDAAGIAYCWGNNQDGQLGNGTFTPESQILRLRPEAIAGNLRFTRLAAGGFSTCGLKSSSTVYCWGSNESGQLGDGTTLRRPAPVLVGGSYQFVDLTMGTSHVCGLTAAGAAYCWGENGAGQLGDGTGIDRTAPTPVAGNLAFASLSAGAYHTCGVLADGTAFCWGFTGIEGSNTCDGGGVVVQCVLSPVAVPGSLHFTSIAPGWIGTCGIEAAGETFCWGRNDEGQLGDGTTTSTTTPTRVLTSERFARISGGSQRNCGMNRSGAAFCWGMGGSIGDGTNTRRLVPTPIAGGFSFQVIGLSQYHLGASCGITVAGTPLCWGPNVYGTLGDGTTTPRLAPTPVKPPE